MPTITEENKNPLTKDPYLKPIVFGGLIITMLTILFAPGIFLWAFLGGYVAIRMSYKLIKKMPTLVDSISNWTFQWNYRRNLH